MNILKILLSITILSLTTFSFNCLGLPHASEAQSGPHASEGGPGPHASEGEPGTHASEGVSQGEGGFGKVYKVNTQAVKDALDSEASDPFLSRAPSSTVLSCDCCDYFKQAIYGEKYDSRGKFQSEGTQEWCRTNEDPSLRFYANRFIASQQQNVVTPAMTQEIEAAAAVKALNRHFHSPLLSNNPQIISEAGRLYKDLNKTGGNVEFQKNARRLVGYSQGVFHNNELNKEHFDKMRFYYRELINSSNSSFKSNPPSSIMAYQKLFIKIHELKSNN